MTFNHSPLEKHLVKQILEWSKCHPQKLRLWRNNTGAMMLNATTTKGKKSKRFVRFGFPGQSDIFGIRADGKFISIECKVGKNRPTLPQQRFGEMITAFNGIHILAYSLEDVNPHIFNINL